MEDSKADIFLVRESIAQARIAAEFQEVSDGEKAINFLSQLEDDASLPCPDLIILDINLPRKPGRAVLAHLRKCARSGSIPVLIVTSSNSDRDREEMESLGTRAYFRKPSEYDEFMKLGDLVGSLLTSRPV